MWRQHDWEVKNLNISINLKISMKQKTVEANKKKKKKKKKNPKVKSMRNLFKITPNKNLRPDNSICDYYFKIRKTYNIHAV